MITIRNCEENDLQAYQEIDFYLWLCVQWNGSYHREDVFTAVDENGQIVGASALFWDGSWYYLDRKDVELPLYKMQMDICIRANCPNEDEVRAELAKVQMKHFVTYQDRYPDKHLRLRQWVKSDDYDKLQLFLSMGFIASRITPILAYDLTKEIRMPETIEGIQFCEMEKTEENANLYLIANEAGFDGMKDSPEEFRFRMQGEDVKIFIAKYGEQIVASTMIWQLGDGHFATENVFTIPEFRRKGIGKELLFTVLRHLKEQGVRKATLTVRGENKKAIALYQKIGYRVEDCLHELHYYEGDRE